MRKLFCLFGFHRYKKNIKWVKIKNNSVHEYIEIICMECNKEK